jgi:hypothetical protein
LITRRPWILIVLALVAYLITAVVWFAGLLLTPVLLGIALSVYRLRPDARRITWVAIVLSLEPAAWAIYALYDLNHSGG